MLIVHVIYIWRDLYVDDSNAQDTDWPNHINNQRWFKNLKITYLHWFKLSTQCLLGNGYLITSGQLWAAHWHSSGSLQPCSCRPTGLRNTDLRCWLFSFVLVSVCLVLWGATIVLIWCQVDPADVEIGGEGPGFLVEEEWELTVNQEVVVDSSQSGTEL